MASATLPLVEVASDQPPVEEAAEKPQLAIICLDTEVAEAKLRVWEFFEHYRALAERLQKRRNTRIEKMTENLDQLNPDNVDLLQRMKTAEDRPVLTYELQLQRTSHTSAQTVHDALDRAMESDRDLLLRLLNDIAICCPDRSVEPKKEHPKTPKGTRHIPIEAPGWAME